MLLCERCEAWEILEGDLRCGWCGEDQFGLDVKSHIRLYVYAENVSAKKEIETRRVLTNLSRSRLAVTCENAPVWLVVNPTRPSLVEPGKSLDLALSVDSQKLGGSTVREGTMTLGIAIANQESESRIEPAKVKVDVWPVPKITIKLLTVFSGNNTSPAELEMELWSDIVVESITFDPAFLRFDGTGLELEVSDRHRLPIRLSLPAQMGSATHSITYTVKVEGLQEPIIGQFEMVVKRPATLKVESRDSASEGHEIIPGTEEIIELVLSNEGDQALKIDGIQILGKTAPEQQPVQIRADREILVIEPGRNERLKLRAKADREATTSNCWFELAFNSNDPNPKNNKYNVKIRVVDESYPDFIALDFGTTDSAVAIFDATDARPMNLPLEVGLLDSKIYSNIFFKSYVAEREMPYAWCIGWEAKSLGTQIVNRGRFIKAIKTKVGTGYREVIPFGRKGFDRTLEAEEIIKFIIRDLLDRTRSALRKRPTRFIVTVPTRFALRRKEMLRETFLRAAESLSLNLNVEIADESLTAGLFYFLMRGPKDEYIRGKESYTAMIVDFGGGTTDTTVFRVRQRQLPDGNVDVEGIDVIGASGDATLGGEEISLEIAHLLAERFLRRSVDPRTDSAEIRKLEDEAEAVKLAVSELLRIERLSETVSIEDVVKNETEALEAHLVYLRVQVGISDDERDQELRRVIESYLQDDSYELPVESNDFEGQVVKINPREVVQIFETRLLRLKTELESLLRRINEMPVDVLLLAGQSSQFPIVKEVLEGLADRVDFVKDPSDALVLKECVSLGALYYSFYLKGDLNLTITGAGRVWTRVGRHRFITGRGMVFEELIPWGSEPPRESDPFKLTRARYVSADNRLEFTVEENLSMGDNLKLVEFGKYELKLQDTSQNDFACKLKVGDKGEIEAFCLIKEEWQPMEFKL